MGRIPAVREEAHRVFDAELETHYPQSGTRPVEERLEPLRRWFTDRWTEAAHSGVTDHQVAIVRNELGAELAVRLPTASEPRQQEPRQQEPLTVGGTRPVSTSHEVEFAAALWSEDVRHSLAEPDDTWNRATTRYYADRLNRFKQQYIEDHVAAEALGPGRTAEVNRLNQGVYQAAASLRARIEPMVAAIRNFRRQSHDLSRDSLENTELTQDAELVNWYRIRQMDVIRRFGEAFEAQGLGALRRLESDFGRQITALRDAARSRHAAIRQPPSSDDETSLDGESSSPATKEWPPADEAEDWRTAARRANQERLDTAYRDILAQAEAQAPTTESEAEAQSKAPAPQTPTEAADPDPNGGSSSPSAEGRSSAEEAEDGRTAVRRELDEAYGDFLAQAEKEAQAPRPPTEGEDQESQDTSGPETAPVTPMGPSSISEYRARFDEAFDGAVTSFRDDADEVDRTLLEAFGAQETEPSDAMLAELRSRLGGELEAAFAEEFGTTDPAATPAGQSERWNARFDQLVGGLPGELAAVAARTAAVARASEAVDTAARNWHESPRVTTAFLRAFGIQTDEVPAAGVLQAIQDTFAEMTEARFRQFFDRIPAPLLPSLLQEWERDYTASIDRLHTWFSLEAAGRSVPATAFRIFDERLDSLDPDHAMSQGQLLRLKRAFTERAQAAFSSLISGTTGEPGELTARSWEWQQRLRDLTAALPAHFAHESTATAGLRDAGVAFQRLSRDYAIDGDRLEGIAAGYRKDWFDAFRPLWAPADLHEAWLGQEAAAGDAFTEGLLYDLGSEGRTANAPPAGEPYPALVPDTVEWKKSEHSLTAYCVEAAVVRAGQP